MGKISGRMTIDEYELGGEYSSTKTLGWFFTFVFWCLFIIGILQMMDTGVGNWLVVAGMPFWLIANLKIKKQTGESLL